MEKFKFNIENFILINNLHGMTSGGSMVETVLIDQKPLINIYDDTISPVEDMDPFDALDMICFSSYSPIVQENTYETLLDKHDENKKFSNIMSDYLSHLSSDVYDFLPVNNMLISFGNKLDIKKYLFYLKDSDILLSPMLFEWLEHRFMQNPKEVLPLNYLISTFLKRVPDINLEVFMKLILKLEVLGFIRINLNSDVHNTPIGDKDKEMLVDRLSVASFIARSLDAHHYDLAISVDNSDYFLDLRSLHDDNHDIKQFCSSVLGSSQAVFGLTHQDEVSPSDADCQSLRLLFFSRIKQLPLKLFSDWYLEESRSYLFNLSDNDYMSKLHDYRMSGMDMVDIALLSILRIKKFSLDGLVSKVRIYKSEEIYRSLIGMMILGLVKIEPMQEKLDDFVAIDEPKQPPVQALLLNKSFLARIMEKLTSK